MTILITGVAGFLGSHLADRLIKDGHKIIGIDNLIGGDIENVPKEVVFYKNDTSDFQAMDSIIKAQKPHIVYHFACIACEGFSVFSPSLITQNTFGNTVPILSAAVQNKVKRFIYASSMSRYGKQPVPFTEDMNPKPEDPYAVAKVASEQIIKMMSDTHGIEYVIAVPHNIIGTRQKYNDPYRNVASIMINRMLQNKQPIIYGDGKQSRIFSFVGDCVDTLVKMMDCPSGEIYNIGPDNKDNGFTTINQLAATIAKIIGFDLDPIYKSNRPREVKDAYCSSDKIRKDFGYKTKTKLEEGIEKMVIDIKRKGTKPFIYNLPVEISDGCPKTWTERLI